MTSTIILETAYINYFATLPKILWVLYVHEAYHFKQKFQR